MRFAPLVLMAAIGASAHPSGHGHNHRALHEKRDGTVVVATIDNKVVSWTMGAGSPFKAAHKPTTSSTSTTPVATTTSTSTPAAETTTAAAATTSTKATTPATTASTTKTSSPSSTSASSSSSESGASSYEAFASCSSSKVRLRSAGRAAKRATAAQIAYTGNTGCDGYGSNIKLIQGSIADKYTYVVKAANSGSSTMQCKVWNKIGPSGAIDGFFSGNEASTFTIAAGSYQHIAFDTNTQGGMCCASGSVDTTSYGEFLCPWLEFDFGNTSNDGWSGFDASALVEGSVDGPYAALKACTADSSVCSTLDGSGGGTNAYLKGDEALDGVGGNLPAGDVSLVATWS